MDSCPVSPPVAIHFSFVMPMSHFTGNEDGGIEFFIVNVPKNDGGEPQFGNLTKTVPY